MKKKRWLVIPSYRDAAKLVHEEHKAAWKNGKHQALWINTLETYAFPTLGDKLVSKIEGPAIRDALSPIWLTKPETARRVRQRLHLVRKKSDGFIPPWLLKPDIPQTAHSLPVRIWAAIISKLSFARW